MPTVGEQLRAAREARKLRVEDVAKATNMRTDHVVALEDGNYAPFPAPVYIRGSVRTYAKLLQLDVMPLMAELALEMNLETRAEEATTGPAHRRGILDFIALQLARFGWKRTAVALAILAIIVLSLLVRVMRSDEPESDPLADLPPPTYQPAKSSDSGYLPLPGTNN